MIIIYYDPLYPDITPGCDRFAAGSRNVFITKTFLHLLLATSVVLELTILYKINLR